MNNGLYANYLHPINIWTHVEECPKFTPLNDTNALGTVEITRPIRPQCVTRQNFDAASSVLCGTWGSFPRVPRRIRTSRDTAGEASRGYAAARRRALVLGASHRERHIGLGAWHRGAPQRRCCVRICRIQDMLLSIVSCWALCACVCIQVRLCLRWINR